MLSLYLSFKNFLIDKILLIFWKHPLNISDVFWKKLQANEWIFDGLQFSLTKIFLKETLGPILVH